MADVATLQDSINWASSYVQGMPVTAFTTNNPALQIASMVRATILSPPFAWAFNRDSFTITTVAGQQDYPQVGQGGGGGGGSDDAAYQVFGYVEKASASDGNTAWQIPDIYNSTPLSLSLTKARPMVLAVQEQVPGTSLTVRFGAVPDAVYTVEVVFQMSPVLFTTLSDRWAPLPDGYNFIYNNLFLGEILADADDPRSQLYRQRGVAALLARAEGLSAQDKAVFMTQYLDLGVAMTTPMLRTQQATQARGN